MEKFEDYKKYRWFFTSSGKLVVAGKNSENNDELLKEIINSGKEYFVMHTSHPGSPFGVIISEIDSVSEEDKKECAIFVGCFSQAWKTGKRKTEVDLFYSSSLSKNKFMKSGTWAVSKKIKTFSVELKLYLTKQEHLYRAVPFKPKQKEVSFIFPGKIDKDKIAEEILKILKLEKEKLQEILSAIPAGKSSLEQI